MSIEDPLADPDRIAFVGDLHGDWGYGVRALMHAAERLNATDGRPNVVVQLGDFGFWRAGEPYLAGMSAVACKLDLPVLWVDGNHENFPELYALPLDRDTGMRPVAPGIWHLPRGFRWSWGGVRFLALGGAHSVDRTGRVPGMDWHREEFLSAAEADRATAGGAADVMVCHDAPIGVDIPGLTPQKWPAADIRSADQHRQRVRQVVDQVQPRWLFHGHYHAPYVADLAGDGYRCTVRGLASNKTPTLPHTVFVQPLRMLAPMGERDVQPAVTGRGRRTSRS